MALTVWQAANVQDVVPGHTTKIFKRSGKPENAHLGFSIVSKDRTLDLDCKSEEDRDRWVAAFRYLVTDLIGERVPEPDSQGEESS
jgi:hypothetical protein